MNHLLDKVEVEKQQFKIKIKATEETISFYAAQVQEHILNGETTMKAYCEDILSRLQTQLTSLKEELAKL